MHVVVMEKSATVGVGAIDEDGACCRTGHSEVASASAMPWANGSRAAPLREG